ncbi:TetR family transcriptional regulator [Streptomyces sp. SLBN-118]|uniref:TetR/AcrR family transcriptional regulator n=1 Tax=Streptomyces sp. SLBN-118 TaxID=2768454 RepID=UPI0011501D3F|nr:TetR/AcrR family transcriptional regulator [Streptomyces sp. SLBN-118]TQK51991.1 TetR family transcriptional regulator [Streptomyces sp. SLBN-118]
MPTARESLLSAALAALADLPWSGVRMVDVASAAGVSRQTLYNEFGSKDGLARALVRREADAYLHGVERLLAERTGAADRLVAVAEWTVAEARAKPLLRALLTACWGERMPAPRPARRGAVLSGVPAQRRADAGPPSPADLVAAVRDRSVAALEQGLPDGRTKEEPADVARRCELAARLALSYVVAPIGEAVGQLVRTAVGGPEGDSGGNSGGDSAGGSVAGPVSASNPTAGDR